MRTTTERFEVPVPAGYALAAASRFVLDFPAAQGGSRVPVLDLAFTLDGSWEPVGVRVTEVAGTLTGELVSDPGGVGAEQVRRHVLRILNLDTDAADYADVGRRDPVVAALMAGRPGLRPVQFASPYEAAAWALIGQRIQQTQAVRIKDRLAAELGTRTTFPGAETLDAFPAPAVLRELGEVPGLATRRVEQLRSLADAALAGDLDASMLRALPAEDALQRLQTLPGVGPFSAELILVRGAGARDVLPRHEKRLAQAMATLYGTDDPARLERAADAWRPYRSWVAVLVRSWAYDQRSGAGSGAPA